MIFVLNANLSLWLRQFEGLHTNLSGSIKAITCARQNGKSMETDHHKIQNIKYKIQNTRLVTTKLANQNLLNRRKFVEEGSNEQFREKARSRSTIIPGGADGALAKDGLGNNVAVVVLDCFKGNNANFQIAISSITPILRQQTI